MTPWWMTFAIKYLVKSGTGSSAEMKYNLQHGDVGKLLPDHEEKGVRKLRKFTEKVEVRHDGHSHAVRVGIR